MMCAIPRAYGAVCIEHQHGGPPVDGAQFEPPMGRLRIACEVLADLVTPPQLQAGYEVELHIVSQSAADTVEVAGPEEGNKLREPRPVLLAERAEPGDRFELPLIAGYGRHIGAAGEDDSTIARPRPALPPVTRMRCVLISDMVVVPGSASQ
jgi:hypothetical protein